MILENEHIKLRALEPEDLDLLYRWENDSDNWHAGCLRLPYSIFDLKQYILAADKDIYETKQLRFIIEAKSTGCAVGTIDLYDFDYFNSRVALGLFIDLPFQKKGFARAGLSVLREFVFTYLNINQLYAHVSASNEIGRALFENCGFNHRVELKSWTREGANFVDVFLYQMFRPE